MDLTIIYWHGTYRHGVNHVYHWAMILTPSLVFLLLISPAIGSFLGVIADRLPRGQDVVRAPSACRACGTPLRARDLVPIWSFVMRRGRARCCDSAIPPWLLYMEIMATGLAVIAVIIAPDPLSAWLTAGFLWLLLGLGVTDLLWFRLPDVLTGALFGVALALGLVWPVAWITPGLALGGAVMGAAGFWLLRWGYYRLRGREGLGLGDVKLMAGCGAALGPHDLPLMVLTAALTALAVTLAGRLTPAATPLKADRALPFGAALAAATAVVWIARRLTL